jgi:hypothetical protein
VTWGEGREKGRGRRGDEQGDRGVGIGGEREREREKDSCVWDLLLHTSPLKRSLTHISVWKVLRSFATSKLVGFFLEAI